MIDECLRMADSTFVAVRESDMFERLFFSFAASSETWQAFPFFLRTIK